jgi:hypothetical protein
MSIALSQGQVQQQASVSVMKMAMGGVMPAYTLFNIPEYDKTKNIRPQYD